MKRVDDIFDVTYGNSLEFINMIPDDTGIPFISRKSVNNGMEARVRLIEEVKPNPPNTISVAASGSVMESFLQKEPYYSGRDLYFLSPKQKMNDNVMLYYCTVLRANKYRYNYGRQANRTLRSILIPEYHEIPNWVNAVDIESRKIKDLRVSETKISLINPLSWKKFLITDLFNIESPDGALIRDLNETDSSLTGHPYITSQATNNAVRGFVDGYTEDGNVLTVDSAVAGYCAYQERPFSSSNDVKKLIPKFTMDKYIAMFLVSVINQEQYRYNYGRKCGKTRLKKSWIKLPATREGDPDWQFMGNYIKSLPYSANM